MRGGGTECKVPRLQPQDQIQAAQTDLDPWGRPCSMGRAGKEDLRQVDEEHVTVESALQKVCTGSACPHGGTLLSGEPGKNLTRYNTEGSETPHCLKEPDVKAHIAVTPFLEVSGADANLWRQRAGGFLGLGMGIGWSRKQARGVFWVTEM